MTKKDYVAIAAALGNAPIYRGDSNKDEQAGAMHAYNAIAFALASKMERDNPRFDRARFLAACGVQS